MGLLKTNKALLKVSQRAVDTPGGTIYFSLTRSARKSIGLIVDNNGLQIRAPQWTPLAQIDAAVLARAKWIQAKLQLRQQRCEQQNTAGRLWKSQSIVPYLGARIEIRRDHTLRQPVLDGELFAPVHGNVLTLALPLNASQEQVGHSTQIWLQQQARAWFQQRLCHFLDKAQLSMNRWRLSGAATRWGSCSSAGNIMLNWRLIHFPHPLVDYVVAHEVAHLRHMNHGAGFWREVEYLLPGYRQARDDLRQHSPGVLPLI